MAEHARHTPAHQVDQEHGADHQGDADGGRVEDAQGAAGGDRGRPFIRLLYRIQRRAVTRVADFTHPLLEVRPVKKRAGHPRVAGQGSVRRAQQQSVPTGRAVRSTSTVFITAGRKAAQFVARTRRELVAEFPYGIRRGSPKRGRSPRMARDLFLKGEVDEVHPRRHALRQHADPEAGRHRVSCRSAKSRA